MIIRRVLLLVVIETIDLITDCEQQKIASVRPAVDRIENPGNSGVVHQYRNLNPGELITRHGVIAELVHFFDKCAGDNHTGIFFR